MKIQKLQQQNYIKRADNVKKEAGPSDSFISGSNVDNLGEQLKSLQNLKSGDKPSRLEGAMAGLVDGFAFGFGANVIFTLLSIAFGGMGGGTAIGGRLLGETMFAGAIGLIEGLVAPEEVIKFHQKCFPPSDKGF